MADIKKLLNDHFIYFIGIGIIATLCVIVLIIEPHADAPEILDPHIADNLYNLVTFGLGLDTTIIIWIIALFLLYRWNKGGRSNRSLLVWSLGFMVYSITFIAHIFKGLGFAWASETSSPLCWGFIIL